jgi:microcystin-dependent protein
MMAAALGIRGANPIWVLVNLWGKLFDDTYWMWVLDNNIPYLPVPVFHDPDLSIEWDNPIQFLANGTLPNDIFFEPNTTYRLEFRQHIGLGIPTQSDPLIYLVEDYMPGAGGGSPFDTIATISSNQITNPQFALYNLSAPFTFTGNAADLPIPNKIEVAPGWFLNLSGTGTVTIAQVPLNNSEANPSNAPYALHITASGWTANSLFLSQRFFQNGMLWANQYVSGAITASLGADELPQNISSQLVDSNATLLGTIIFPQAVVPSFNQLTGSTSVPLPATTNPDLPPAAYIDYQILLPSNIDIFVSSIQLLVQDTPAQPVFEQDSINRQIDHTYNTAYPIVPVGTVIDYYAFGTPAHYLLCNGVTISRAQYQLLFSKLTNVEVVTLTSGSPNITVANGNLYAVGYPVEGTGIPAATTISSISGNNIVLSANATITSGSSLRFFCVGNGDGSTTFNLPDLRGLVLAGAFPGNTALPGYGVGQNTGASTVALSIANMPAHNHPGSTIAVGNGGGGGSLPTGHDVTSITTNSVSVASQGSGTAFSVFQPTQLAQKMIRYE